MMAVERGQKHLDEVKQKAFKNNIDIKTDVIIGKTSVVKSIVEYAERVQTNKISKLKKYFDKMLLLCIKLNRSLQRMKLYQNCMDYGFTLVNM